MQFATIIFLLLLSPEVGIKAVLSAGGKTELPYCTPEQPSLPVWEGSAKAFEGLCTGYLPGTGLRINRRIDTGPGVSDKDTALACRRQHFRLLSKNNKIADLNRPLPSHEKVIIELITKDNNPLDTDKLKQVLSANRIHLTSVYQWQNHYVVFDTIQNGPVVKTRIQRAFPGIMVKFYDHPFYDFNRHRCSDTAIARDWDHVILTANLVNNARLQREYMNYHATQFNKWPEVATGFCNANFQQLLLFRNGRQLVLVISIPKGTSLDELNPKTTENNPRVDEWNALMKKYQVGIAGTKQGETWVLLKEL